MLTSLKDKCSPECSLNFRHLRVAGYVRCSSANSGYKRIFRPADNPQETISTNTSCHRLSCPCWQLGSQFGYSFFAKRPAKRVYERRAFAAFIVQTSQLLGKRAQLNPFLKYAALLKSANSCNITRLQCIKFPD